MDTLSFTFDLLIFYLLRKNLSIFFQINRELSLFQNIFINIRNFQIYHWLHLKVIFRILDQTFWLNSYFITIVFILIDLLSIDSSWLWIDSLWLWLGIINNFNIFLKFIIFNIFFKINIFWIFRNILSQTFQLDSVLPTSVAFSTLFFNIISYRASIYDIRVRLGSFMSQYAYTPHFIWANIFLNFQDFFWI